jgi:predicted metal-dependent peptidase
MAQQAVDRTVAGFTGESPATQTVMKARSLLLVKHHFFAQLSLGLKLQVSNNQPTAWTDGKSFGYNEDFILQESQGGKNLEPIKGLWGHEDLHVALLHHLRLKGRNHAKANRAMDYAVNLLLDEAGFQLPQGALLDVRYKGMPWEQIYDLLPDEPADSEPQDGSSGDGEGDSGDGQGAPGDKPGQGGKGKPKPGQWGQVRSPKNETGGDLSESEMAELEAKTKVAVGQALNAARMQGTLPGCIERAMGEILNPRPDLVEVLRQFVDTAAREDFSWKRPNRGYINRGIYVPSLYSDELMEACFIMDTSGSVGEEDLRVFGELLSGILAELNVKLTIIYVDTMVAGHEEVERADLPLNLHPKGGGGTDFRPGFKWIEDQGIDPKFVIYLTDMCCSSFPADPGYPVLWARLGCWNENPPPFGEVVDIPYNR